MVEKSTRKPYVPSPEAAERRRERDRIRARAKTAEKRKDRKLVLNKSDLPAYKILARRMRPKLGPMTKAELREMLTSAVKNTGGSNA